MPAARWTDVTPALVAAGAPADRWVSRVFASPYDADVAFVAKNGFRNDDFAPYLYKTTDGGKTWTSIAANLPEGADQRRRPGSQGEGSAVRRQRHRRVRVDRRRRGVDADEGATCRRSRCTICTIHPRENDLVLGTYGRAFWTGDITPLQELSAKVLDSSRRTCSTSSRGRATASARRG